MVVGHHIQDTSQQEPKELAVKFFISISVFNYPALSVALLLALLIPQCGCLVAFCVGASVETRLLGGSLYTLIL